MTNRKDKGCLAKDLIVTTGQDPAALLRLWSAFRPASIRKKKVIRKEELENIK
jgi:hypothetical protein